MVMRREFLRPLLVITAILGLAASVATAEASAARPAPGAVVSKPPLLRWKPVAGARYYNVQLYRDGRKVLSRWPTRPRFKLHWNWQQGRHRFRFRPGVYRWYVWPYRRNGYGRSIVRSRFRAGRLPSNTVLPEISGTAQEGVLLSASSGRWTGTRPIAFAYQWQRCGARGESCANLPGGRGRSLRLTADDIDTRIRVVVTARNWLGRRSAASAPTSIVLPAAPSLAEEPEITGPPQVGMTLTTDVGAWISSRPLDYTVTWHMCDRGSCWRVETGERRTFVLRRSALGRRVHVVVSASNAGGTRSAASRPTASIGRRIAGTHGADRLAGTSGSDVLFGRAGDDSLRGGPGEDRLVGGRGWDRLRAGPGDDSISARDGTRDLIGCGSGDDVVLADRKDRIAETCEVIRRNP
jgi:RTX calcium-binding nonapeptide repeat (4 copies)